MHCSPEPATRPCYVPVKSSSYVGMCALFFFICFRQHPGLPSVRFPSDVQPKTASRRGSGHGSGVPAQAGFEPGSDDCNQTFSRTFRTSPVLPLFFLQSKGGRTRAHGTVGFGNKSYRLHFLWDFRSCPLAETFPGSTLQNLASDSFYLSSSTR
jgi:hypothetical protein